MLLDCRKNKDRVGGRLPGGPAGLCEAFQPGPSAQSVSEYSFHR